MRKKLRFLFVLLISLYIENGTLSADDGYQLGEGVEVGSLPLYVGGYFSLDYTNNERYEQYRLDDLSLLGYGSYEKFSYLAEVEYKELYLYRDENGTISESSDNQLQIERLYGDYAFNEHFNARIGKYNTPVGFWNLVPINVLRETTSSPLVTEIIYPEYTTGAELSYSTIGDASFRADVMLQFTEGISETYNNYNTDEHVGLGLSYGLDDLVLKANAGYFNLHDGPDERLYYGVLSFNYEKEDYQFLSEVGWRYSDRLHQTNYAGYLQGLYRLTPQHIAIVRLERYADRSSVVEEGFGVFGYTYRPWYSMALKSEYSVHSDADLNTFILSFSVLF